VGDGPAGKLAEKRARDSLQQRMVLETYIAELHVHTVLSPCAEVEMIPPLIVQEALARGIRLIAITDHNISTNVAAVQQAAAGSGVVVLPGMEAQTREEVHVLCLFDTLAQVQAWEAELRPALPPLENDAAHFGEQFVVDAAGDFVRRETQLLLTSAHLSIEEICQGVERLGGLTIPAHVDRKAFGLIANLGLVPPGLPIAALEVSRHLHPFDAPKRFPQLKGYPLLQGGDAHRLEEMTGVNVFRLAAPTVAEIKRALRNEAGRGVTYRA
jgi:3',5'-nucleoside bisphosphate phosphatase